MAARLQQVPVVKRLKYTDNVEEILSIPKTNIYRRYTAHFRITIKTGSTAFDADAGTIRPHGILNLIKHMRLEIGSGVNKFHYSGVDKFLIDTIERGLSPHVDRLTDIPANSSKTFHAYLIFDFATARHRLSDFSALLDAIYNQQNDFYVQWGNINDLYTGNARTTL